MNCLLATFVVILAVFSQTQGHCGSRLLQTSLTRAAVRAAEWLRNQQDENGTYGEGHVTAVALHSLRLVGFPVEQGAEHLNAEIIENDIGSIPGARVGSYILGAMACCQNPKSFYDFDLARALITKLDKFPRLRFDHPYQYSFAVMALCSTGAMRLDYLQNIMRDIPEQLETEDGVSGDTLSMQVMALTCAKKSMKKKDMKVLKSKIQVAIDLASKELQARQMNDSTFGENEVTAALVSQALLAAGVKKTKCTKTMRWLKSRQNPDGSFVNLMATIFVLPSLIGALPYDVQNIPCPKNTTVSEIERKMINVCVELQFEENKKYSKDASLPPRACVEVLNGTNAHDILEAAANHHPCYNFTALNTAYGRMITSICDIEQRPADKYYWVIYVDGKSAPVGIDDLRPADGSILRFQYKQLKW